MVFEPEKEKLHSLEDMKRKLFVKDYKSLLTHRSGTLHHKDLRVSESWGDEGEKEEKIEEKFFMKTSMFKKFFMFSIGFFVLAIIFALYTFLGGGNTVSNDNIDIAVLGNTFTAGGEDLPLQIEVTNKNNVDLELADLVIEYPKGSSLDLTQDTERLRDSLGTIPSGQIKTDNMKVVLFGEQGSTRPVKITLEYRVAGSNAIFVKEKDYSVTINSAPIDINLDAPITSSPNQDVTFVVKTTLNATKSASGLLLKADYPPGFVFKSANPSPTIGNNVWNLGDLSPGAERDTTITGRIIGAQDGEDKTFHFYAGSQDPNDKSNVGVVFNSLGHTILIKKPFIQAQLAINGITQNEYASDSKTPIQATINWTNNLPTKISNAVIVAKISGNALDRKKIVAQDGFYNSANDTITWDKNSNPDFAEINPTDAGAVVFSLGILPLFTSSGMIVDPVVNIDISISGQQPLDGNSTSIVNDNDSKVIKIISDANLVTKLLHFSGPFTNTGPVPPQSDKTTTYTVTWTLSNTSNNVSNAKVSSTLPPLVKFVGPISPTSEDLKYNPSTQEIVWNIGNIPKGTGVNGTSKEVSFQISLTPSSSQVGTTPIIVNDAILTGHDDFANVDVRVNRAALTTRLPNDPQAPGGADRVIQ